jgi:hypothetical protein
MSLNLNKVTRTILYAVCAVAVLLVMSTSASAQSADNFKVNYFDNNSLTTTGAPESIVHVLNPGSGALCADIYVWKADQELTECCACPISTNGLLTFTVDDATNNPGDGNGPATSGSIDIVSDSNAVCDPTNPAPAAALRAWGTHVNFDSISGGYDVTETEFLDTPLASGEQSEAASRCGFLESNGTGAGICTAICTEFGSGGDSKPRTRSIK